MVFHVATSVPLHGIPANAFALQQTNTLERRLFFIPSFKIYGSVAGFYDFGPPGCSIKQNITQFWRQHFVLEENMLELECPAVTPEVHHGFHQCLSSAVVFALLQNATQTSSQRCRNNVFKHRRLSSRPAGTSSASQISWSLM